MAYSTPSLVRDRLKGIPTTGDFTDEKIGSYIDRADNRINAALAPLYDVPLDQPPPPLVVDLSADLAAAYVLRFLTSPQTGEEDRPDRAYAAQVKETLKALRDGESELIDTGGNVIQRKRGQFAPEIAVPDVPIADLDEMLATFTLER